MNKETNNPLGVQPVNRLLSQFAIPSIISMLVGSLYNIVDQFFIGQRVGELGNAATNIAFPLSTSCLALALLIGIGGSSAFNLAMGSGHEKRAVNIMGNAVVLLAGSGLVLSIITLLFLKPLLLFFGSPKAVLPYAMEYTKITAFGFPFLLLSTGGGHLIRADGRPRITMLCNLVGAVLNTILDALFVFGLNLGMSGAALATIIGQIVSGSSGNRVFDAWENSYNTQRKFENKMGKCNKNCFAWYGTVQQSGSNDGCADYYEPVVEALRFPLDLRRKYSDCVCRHYYKSKHDFYVLCHWTFAGLTADCKF